MRSTRWPSLHIATAGCNDPLMKRPTSWVLPIVVGVLALGLSGCALALWSPLPWLIGVALAALCALGAGCGASTGVGDDADGDIDADADAEPDECGGARCPEHMSCASTPEGFWCYPDVDEDGVVDWEDNCPWLANAGQADLDGDGVGDACDLCVGDDDLVSCGDACCNDADGDGVPGLDVTFGTSSEDNCPFIADSTQTDRDSDGVGDLCDMFPDEPNVLSPCGDPGVDSDADGLSDWGYCGGGEEDLCPTTPSADSGDRDADSIPDVCDEDGVPPIAMARPDELRRAMLDRLAAEGVLDAETVRLALG
jgi:hypothetical protein